MTIEARLENILTKTVADMKACANACDAYARKTFVTKVVVASRWNAALAEYITKFEKRRDEIVYALSFHIAATVNEVDRKLDAMTETLDDNKRKLIQAIELFTKAVTPEQEQLAALIDKKGGFHKLDDEMLLSLRLRFERTHAVIVSTSKDVGRDDADDHSLHLEQNAVEYLEVVRWEAIEDAHNAINNNMKVFETKLNMQIETLKTDIEAMLQVANNALLVEIKAGAHDKLVDDVGPSRACPVTFIR